MNFQAVCTTFGSSTDCKHYLSTDRILLTILELIYVWRITMRINIKLSVSLHVTFHSFIHMRTRKAWITSVLQKSAHISAAYYIFGFIAGLPIVGSMLPGCLAHIHLFLGQGYFTRCACVCCAGLRMWGKSNESHRKPTVYEFLAFGCQVLTTSDLSIKELVCVPITAMHLPI